MHLQEEERKEARHKTQELWAEKKEKELQAKSEEDKEHEAEKQKQHCYDAYKRKLKEDLCEKIEKDKEELEMHEVEMKYKAELTAQVREEYGISKVAPVNNAPVSNPAPPGNSNLGFSTIKMEHMDAKDCTNPLKKTVPTKRHLEGFGSSTPPKKRVASAAEFKDLMTPKKTKTSLRNKFALPKPTSYSTDREDPTFEISNQEYLCSIMNIKVDKMKMVHDFLWLKPTKDFTLKLWDGLEKCNCLVDRESLEGFDQIELDSFCCILLQYFHELQSSKEEICCANKLRHILVRFAAVNCVALAEVTFFLLFFILVPTQIIISMNLCLTSMVPEMFSLYVIIWPQLH